MLPGSARRTARADDGGDVTPARPVVVVAGLGDTGILVATRLSASCDVVAVSPRPALVSGQELGTRLVDPDRWQRTYLIPFARFRRMDRVRTLHGRLTAVDLDAATATVELAAGDPETIAYDAIVIATGVTNGFWRHDRVQDLASVGTEVAAAGVALDRAATVAVVGGGATGVSVADNLARTGRAEVHLFHGGDEPLPGYHPRVRRWMAAQLRRDGVVVHPGHRAEVPAGFAGDALTHDPVTWSTGQEPFTADVVLWATGQVRPHTGFLPAAALDPDGFVRVDEHLRLPGTTNAFAVGDVAASDPLRSSARNWGFRVVVANVRSAVGGRPRRLRRYRPAPYRWGSVLGLQTDGLTVVQPNGRRVRFSHRIAERFLFGSFVTRYLYGGLRRDPRG